MSEPGPVSSSGTPADERPWSCVVAACDQLENACTRDRAHTACTVRNAPAAPVDGHPADVDAMIPKPQVTIRNVPNDGP